MTEQPRDTLPLEPAEPSKKKRSKKENKRKKAKVSAKAVPKDLSFPLAGTFEDLSFPEL